MTSLLLVSITVRLAALVWTLVALHRLRDSRILYLTTLLALMTLRQVLTLRSIETSAASWTALPDFRAELTGLLVSFLALAAAVHLPRTLVAEMSARSRLRQLEARYRDLFEQAPLTYVVTRDQGGEPIIEDCNQTFLELTGYERSEVVGLPLAKFYTEGSRHQLLEEGGYKKALEGEFTEAERRLLTKDGRVVEMLLQARPERDWLGKTVGTRALFTDITDRKLAEGKLRRSRERLRKLAARLEAVREEERTFIAREIHDELGQRLTGLKLDLAWLGTHTGIKRNSELRPRVREMILLVDQTMDSVRDLSSQLRPPVLDDLGLVPAIEWQANQLSRRFGIQCHLDLPAQDLDLDAAHTTAVFRILQEALTNVGRHSGATHVDISLRTSNGDLLLDVSDNGKGIDEESIWKESSLGLIGMRERAGALGGRVHVRPRQAGGTTVAVNVPV